MKIAVLVTGQLRDYKINVLNHLNHLVRPNNADVFVYACTKNTLHSTGNSLEQRYYTTNEYSEQEIKDSMSEIYGKNLRKVVVESNENLPDGNFGTLGYFRTRMQNQIDNIGKGFELAKEYSSNKGFEYDVVVRCRPDNAMFPLPLGLSALEYTNDKIYSTRFTPSGHRDLCFFAIANPYTFEKYCSFKYLENEDATRTDGDFLCTEFAWEEYLKSIGVAVKYIPDVCKPFTGFDKTQPVTEFPFRDKNEFLIDKDGNLVSQVEP